MATAFRLPSSLRDELQAAATERDVSVHFLVIRVVAAYLRQLPPLDPVEPRGRGRLRPAADTSPS